MDEPVRVDLFVEDGAQEQFAREIVLRLAQEEGVDPILAARAMRGGAAVALAELRAFQKGLGTGSLGPTPDLLVAVIDADEQPWVRRRAEVEEAIDREVVPMWVVGCPEPCVESWYLADAEAFRAVVSVQPAPSRRGRTCADEKKRLADAVRGSKVVSLWGGIDLAPDIVRAMDFFRAGKAEPSLKDFADGLRGAIRSIARTRRRP